MHLAKGLVTSAPFAATETECFETSASDGLAAALDFTKYYDCMKPNGAVHLMRAGGLSCRIEQAVRGCLVQPEALAAVRWARCPALYPCRQCHGPRMSVRVRAPKSPSLDGFGS